MKIYQDDYIEVHVLDEKGAGGAHHKYKVVHHEKVDDENARLTELGLIDFQKGNIAENGVNGITNEALLAIVIHRLECFQSGRFPCDANANALVAIERALVNLEIRTRERKARGVEGKETQ